MLLTLMVILAARNAAVGGPEVEGLLDWVRRRLDEYVETLKDTPCY